jgi:uncharacterized membrane protein SirB2
MAAWHWSICFQRFELGHDVNIPGSSLVVLLRVVAVIQIAMVAVNLNLVHVLGLHDGLTRWPAAVRELFVVHLLCISLMVLTISVLTLRFVREIANQSQAICRWLAGAAALFWLLRGGLQLFYSLSTQWPINQLHWVFTAVDGFLALVYGVAAWGVGERN